MYRLSNTYPTTSQMYFSERKAQYKPILGLLQTEAERREFNVRLPPLFAHTPD